jgi:hypothetical protein
VWSDRIHKAGDIALGLTIFTFLFAVSLLNQVFGVGKLQGVLLFNSVYAQQYITEQEVKGTVVERWHQEYLEDRKAATRQEAAAASAVAAIAAAGGSADPKKRS